MKNDINRYIKSMVLAHIRYNRIPVDRRVEAIARAVVLRVVTTVMEKPIPTERFNMLTEIKDNNDIYVQVRAFEKLRDNGEFVLKEPKYYN